MRLRRTVTRFLIPTVVLVITAVSCGEGAGADPGRMCEIWEEEQVLENPDEIITQLPEGGVPPEVKTAFRLLWEEAVEVAPAEVQAAAEEFLTSGKVVLDSVGVPLDEIREKAFLTASDRYDAATRELEVWYRTNCDSASQP